MLWSGGKEQAQIERAGMGLAAELLNEPGLDIAELTGSTAMRVHGKNQT